MDAKIKIKEVDISNDDRPTMENIREYWTKQQTTDITSLLKEYKYMFARDYKYLKGLVKEIGEMKIDINSNAKPVKKSSYKLTHKYKEIVKKEI